MKTTIKEAAMAKYMAVYNSAGAEYEAAKEVEWGKLEAARAKYESARGQYGAAKAKYNAAVKRALAKLKATMDPLWAEYLAAEKAATEATSVKRGHDGFLPGGRGKPS
jgi:hypothetical protein